MRMLLFTFLQTIFKHNILFLNLYRDSTFGTYLAQTFVSFVESHLAFNYINGVGFN